MTAPRTPHARPGRRARLLAMGAATLALGLAAATPSIPVAAAQAPPTTTTTTTAGPGSGAGAGTAPRPATTGSAATAVTGSSASSLLQLRGQTAFVAPTDTFKLTLGLGTVPADASIGLELRNPITANPDARVRLDDFAGGTTPTDVFGRTPANGAGIPLAFVARDANGNVTLPLQIVPGTSAVPELGFRIGDAGVYPLVVTLDAGPEQVELARFTTFLIRLPEADSKGTPMAFSSVVPFRAPLAMGTDGTVSLGDDTRRRLAAIVTATRANPTIPLTVVPNPETVDALRLLPADQTQGITPDDLHLAWKDRDLVSGPFVPLDINAFATSDLRAELGAQLDLGGTTLDRVVQPTRPADRHTWPAAVALTSPGSALLTDTGATRFIVPDTAVAEPDPKAFRPEQAQVVTHQPFALDMGTGAPVRAITTDTRIRNRYTETDNTILNSQLVLAEAAVDYFGAQRRLNPLTTKARALVVDVPVDTAGLATFATVQAAFASTPDPALGGGRAILVPASVDQVFALPDAATAREDGALVRTYRPDPPAVPGTMGDYGERLAAAQLSVAGFGSMVRATDPDRVAQLERSIHVSGDAQLTPGQRQDYLDAVSGTVQTTVEGIEALNQEQITLAATEAELRVQIQNRNDFPVAVRMRLTSDNKLDFPNGADFVTTLQPGLNRVPVQVQVRAAGTFPLFVKLTSPDNRIDLGATRLDVRSTAVSGLGLLLSLGAGAFLLIWWIRNFRKTRRPDKLIARDRDDAGSGPPAGTDAAPGPGGSDAGLGAAGADAPAVGADRP